MWRNILTMAVPLILAQAVQVLYNVVDRVYIGHLPADAALAFTGIGLTFPIVNIISAFTNLFGSGGAPLCSIARGRGDIARARRIMCNCFVMLLATGFVLMAVCYLGMKPILYLFGASDATWLFARDYLYIYLLGTPFVMVGLGMNSFVNAQGFGRMGMMTVALGAVVNLILDPIFIFGFNMGVQGAALAPCGKARGWCCAATVVSCLLAVAGCLLWTPTHYETLYGLQGRYFLPVLPLALLLWGENRWLCLGRDLTRPLALAQAALCGLAALQTMALFAAR